MKSIMANRKCSHLGTYTAFNSIRYQAGCVGYKEIICGYCHKSLRFYIKLNGKWKPASTRLKQVYMEENDDLGFADGNS